MGAMSKSQAEFVATTLLSKRTEEIKKLEDETLAGKLREWYTASLDSDVLEAFKNPKVKEYLEKNHYCYVRGIGIPANYQYYYFKTELPKKQNCSIYLNLTNTQAEEFVKLTNKLDDLKKELIQLNSELIATLTTLTKKQIIQEFPEAARFFEEKKTTALAVNIEDLRKRIPV